MITEGICGESMNEFGEFIKGIREAKNLTLMEVAEKSGINHSHLSRIENGERNPPKPKTMKNLAVALGVSFATLLEKAGLIEESEKDLLSSTDDPEEISKTLKRERDRKNRNLRDARKFLEQSDIMFDGVPMSEEDRQQILKVMESMFWKAKEMNRRKPKE